MTRGVGRPGALTVGATVGLLVLGPHAASVEEIKVETLTPRPGVSLQVLVLRADNPVASVVLFTGGDGKLGGFQPNGTPAAAATSWCAPARSS